MFSQRVLHPLILLVVVTLAQSVSTVSAEPRADNLANAIEKLSDSGVTSLKRAIQQLANASNELVQEKSSPWAPSPDCPGNFERCLIGANNSYELCKEIAEKTLAQKTAECKALALENECLESDSENSPSRCVSIAERVFVMNMDACRRSNCKDLWTCLDDLRLCRRQDRVPYEGGCE